jgi:hypothetical protein
MNKEVAEIIRAYAEGSDFLEAERMDWLGRMTPEEAWAAFESLYRFWEQTGHRSGGDWAALERLKLEEKIELRRAFERLARAKGLL